MADLYKQTKSKNWYMRFTDEHGKQVRRTTRTADRSAAQMILANELRAVKLRDLGIGAASPMGMHTPIKEVIKDYLASITIDGIRPQWVKQQRYRLDRMVDEMRLCSLADITTEKLKRYIIDHPTAKAHQTKKQYIVIIGSLCRWAMDQSPPMLTSNPAADAMPRLTKRAANLHEHRQLRRPLWTHEIPLLLNALPQEKRQRIVFERFRGSLYVVALRTGFRRETLEQITPAMIKLDIANPHIFVPPEFTKSGRGISMPLTDPAVIEHIEKLLKYTFDRSKHSRSFGRPFSPVPKSDTTFQSDLARAGIERIDELGRRVVFHSLRMTFATQLAIQGVPPKIAMELMDHRSISTTMKYYTLVGEVDTRQFMRRLPKIG